MSKGYKLVINFKTLEGMAAFVEDHMDQGVGAYVADVLDREFNSVVPANTLSTVGAWFVVRKIGHKPVELLVTKGMQYVEEDFLV